MIELPSGAFKAKDGETLTVTVSCAETLFGANFSLGGSGGPLPEESPFDIVLNRDKATGASDIPNAKSTVLVFSFSYTSPKNGKYHYKIESDAGDPDIEADAPQAGSLPTVHDFIIHIVGKANSRRKRR